MKIPTSMYLPSAPVSQGNDEAASRLATTLRPTLGVVAISHNEEEDLPGFLENLLPWVDEIVIVDDGSTDRTVELVKAAGAKVRLVISPKQDDEGFCDQRNKGAHTARSEWLLHMDIDERVTPELATEILATIGDESKDAYRYRRLNFFLHRPITGGNWQTWNNIQLARRHLRFSRHLHEVIVAPDSNKVGQLEGFMWHLGDSDYSERLRKSLVYCEIEAKSLIAAGARVTWFHLLARPCWSFVKSYLLRCGFRDGVAGLICNLHIADATFRKLALAWDRQHPIARECIQDRLTRRWSQMRVGSTPPSLDQIHNCLNSQHE